MLRGKGSVIVLVAAVSWLGALGTAGHGVPVHVAGVDVPAAIVAARADVAVVASVPPIRMQVGARPERSEPDARLVLCALAVLAAATSSRLSRGGAEQVLARREVGLLCTAGYCLRAPPARA